jgi:hypothetical protein
MFFTTVTPYDDGMSIKDLYDNLKTALDQAMSPNKLIETLTSIENQAIKLQKSIGGVVDDTGRFQDQLFKAYQQTQALGGTFKDAVSSVQGLAKGMGKVVAPTDDVLAGIIGIAKGIGETPEVIGEMTSNLTRFGGKQLEIIKSIDEMSKTARKSGLDAKAFLSEVNTNLGKVSGFGFKSGVDGLKNMVKQAKLLRTDMAALGAMQMQDSILEPEGAIAAAAGFQMLGGEIGKLGDPFQLMHMAQTDLQGLQDELAKSAASSASFNKETGNFDIATADLYRLKEQARLTGGDFNKLVDAGKEAAKLDFLKDKFNLEGSGLDPETIDMVAGLANIGKDGKVEIDIPGYKKLEIDNAEQLEVALKDGATIDALKKYQEKAGMDSEKLAIAQLSVSEKQAINVEKIRDAILFQMSDADRKALTKAAGETSVSATGGMTNIANDNANIIVDGAKKQLESTNNLISILKEDSDNPLKQNARKLKNEKLGGGADNERTKIEVDNEDLFLSEGSAPQLFSKGTLYKGIVGDEVAIGTGLSEAFNKTGKLTELMASIPSTNNGSGENTSVNGKIDININLGGSVSGDNGNVEKMFSDPKFQKQMMDMVLYKMDKYKQQQGTLS